MWVRHVVVPGITDGEDHIRNLAKKIRELKNVVKVELLPYHTMGENKYEVMNMKYKLEGVEPMDRSRNAELMQLLLQELGEGFCERKEEGKEETYIQRIG